MEAAWSLFSLHPWTETAAWLAILAAVSAFVNFVVKRALVEASSRILAGLNGAAREFGGSSVIPRLANAGPALVVSAWIMSVPGLPESAALVVRNVSNAFIILCVAMAGAAGADLFDRLWHRKAGPTGRSVRGYVQVGKILLYGIAAILMVAAVLDRSPMILLSGLGALTAVLMLVFQDTLLSFVASVQISSTDMLKVGDWIEVPSMNADGDVVEIALHPAGGAVEEIDGPPEQLFEIGLEAGVIERRDKGVEDVGDGGGDGIALGQRAGIGFVLERTPAVELELREGVIGLGGGVDRLGPCIFGINRHRERPSSGDRAHRGLRRRRSARAGRVGSPRPLREGLDGRGWTILTFAMQRRGQRRGPHATCRVGWLPAGGK